MHRCMFLLLVSGYAVENGVAEWPGIAATTDTDFLYQQNQVYFNRKERYIKFDTKDTEIEVELGISVPFLTIPLRSELAKQQAEGGHVESKIVVNAAGVFVAGLLMLTSFIIVPLIFHKTGFKKMGFGRSAEDNSDFWKVLSEVDQVLAENHVNTSVCSQKAVCWLAKTSKGGKEGSIGRWIDGTLRTWWMTRLINGTPVQDAVTTGLSQDTCAANYPQCPVTQSHLKLAFMTFLSGFSR